MAIGLPRFRRDRPGDTFRGWLATIAQNRIRDFHRRAVNRPLGIGGSEFNQLIQNLPDPAAESDASLIGEIETERRGLLHRTLDLVRAEFEERTWTAFWRATVDADPPEVVAAELGISLNAVYKAKSRVLRRLREELDGIVC